MASVQLQNVTKAWGDVVVSKDINLDIHEGEFVVFVGPSGCGKSTLLRMIAGLETITSGDLFIGDTRMNEIPPAERGVGMVFQSYALYPHLSVAENMSFGLKLAGAKKDLINQRVTQVAEVLQLAHLLERKPKALSGGQRQRVAIGRTLVAEPSVFLLDEPLSNLDAALRVQMRIEISRLHKRLGRTMIYVTHDQVEAMTLADKIVVLDAGRVAQVGKPLELYHYPADRFVAGFIGSPQMNFIDAVLKKANNYYVEFGSEATKTSKAVKYQIEIPAAKVTPALADYVDKEVVLGIRPEALHDDQMFLSNATTGVVDATVEITEMMGAETFLYLQCAGISMTARVDPRSTARPQDDIKIAMDPNKIHLFNKETEETIIN